MTENQNPDKETESEKDNAALDPVDLARLERESKQGKRGGDQKLNFFLLKLIMFVFVAIAMGMCSVKYIS